MVEGTGEVELEFLPLLHRHQIVDSSSLGSRSQRRDRALDIVVDAGESLRMNQVDLGNLDEGLPDGA